MTYPVVATTHLIARVVYRMLKNKVEYVPLSLAQYEQRYREQRIKFLQIFCAPYLFESPLKIH